MRDDSPRNAVTIPVGRQACRRDGGGSDAQDPLRRHPRPRARLQGAAPVQGAGTFGRARYRRPRALPRLDQRRDESNDRLDRLIGVRSRPDSLATSIRNSRRATLAVLIVALWAGGMTMMFPRGANPREAGRPPGSALRPQPAPLHT